MTVRVAIAGVGNCGAVFLEGLEFYSSGGKGGLWHPEVAGLRPSDVKVVSAFDIDPRKVGSDLSDAAFTPPNVPKRYVGLSPSGVVVGPGISRGDIPPHLRGVKPKATEVEQVADSLKSSKSDILVNIISSGSDSSTEAYATAALRARCAFVNCSPSLLLKKRSTVALFSKARLPLVGDDMMSQFGGTAFHKGLLELMVKRGVKVSKSYQLDVGGGSETLNTIDETIKVAKRQVKTSAVASEVPYQFETIAGTTDYVDYMGNDRTSYFWFQGAGFMNAGVSVDIYLRSSDGANAGNVLLDVVRATYDCLRNGKQSRVDSISAYGFKSPPKPAHLDEAHSRFETLFVT